CRPHVDRRRRRHRPRNPARVRRPAVRQAVIGSILSRAETLSSPVALSRTRSWIALLLAVLGLLVLPAAVDLSRRSKAVSLLDARYAIPGAFLLGLVALILARRGPAPPPRPP